MTRLCRELIRSRDLPIRLTDIRGFQRNISPTTVLIDEEVEFITADISRIGLEGRGSLDGFRPGVPSDARGDFLPGGQRVEQDGGALLDDIHAAGSSAFVLGEAVVLIAGFEDGGVDAGGTGILPDLGRTEGDKVLGGGVQHSVVGASRVVDIAFGIQG